MKTVWHSKHEKHIFLKYVIVTIVCFLIVATINFGLVVHNLKPINIVLPLVIGTFVGILLGYNALLRKRLTRSNNTKTQFLSRMNHELRTPMNAIIGFAELLYDEDNLDKEQKNGIQRIIGAGNHTLGLINELLDFASVETGKVRLDPEPFYVNTIVKLCIDLTKTLADKRGITIKNHDEDVSDLKIIADEMRLKQVIINLLSNAIKYNRDNGNITISYEIHPSSLKLLVSDSGNGIEPGQLPYLFEPFNRLGAEKTNIEGTGVGLAITKSLVELMQGQIGCESIVDRGTTFWITIPLASSSAPLQ